MSARGGPVGGGVGGWGSRKRPVARGLVQVGQPVACRWGGGREMRSRRLGALHGVVGQAAGEPTYRVPVTVRRRAMRKTSVPIFPLALACFSPPSSRVSAAGYLEQS
jgi:hypothetical protein